jgi:hypothetical protein
MSEPKLTPVCGLGCMPLAINGWLDHLLQCGWKFMSQTNGKG